MLYSVIAIFFKSVFQINIYSLSPPSLLFCRSTGQTIKMETENLHVVYYVNKDFRNEYKGVSLQKVEKSVEEDYVSNIRNNCWKERQQSKFGNMPNFMKACITIKKMGSDKNQVLVLLKYLNVKESVRFPIVSHF